MLINGYIFTPASLMNITFLIVKIESLFETSFTIWDQVKMCDVTVWVWSQTESRFETVTGSDDLAHQVCKYYRLPLTRGG